MEKTISINEELRIENEQTTAYETLIAQKIRDMAIIQLKLEGKLK